MTQQEKFRIWDSTLPKVEEVQAYLDRLYGKTLLPLLYLYPERNSGQIIQQFLADEKDHLVGVFINENTVALLNCVTASDLKPLSYGAVTMHLSGKVLNYWVRNVFKSLPKARAATKKDISLLDEKLPAFLSTLDCLRYHGVSVPEFSQPGWLENNSEFVRTKDGESLITQYLNTYGDLLVFANYPAKRNYQRKCTS